MGGEDERKEEWWRQKRWWIPALLVVVGFLVLVIIGPPTVIRASRPDIAKASAADQLKAENDLRGILVTMLAGGAVVAGTVVAGLNFRETRRQNQESSELQRRGQVIERFGKAIDQLGARGENQQEKLDIRLGGIYALEQIAHDSAELSWPIVEILTAFIREHTKPGAGASNNPADIQAALTMLGRRDSSRDLGPLNLDAANLQGAELFGANLQDAELFGAILQGARLFGANLQGAHLVGALLLKAQLSGANLQGADLSRANLQDAMLEPVRFLGAPPRNTNLLLPGANLRDATLSGANLWGVDLSGTVGLTQDQLDTAICDEHTKPPPGLTIGRVGPEETTSS